MKRKNHTLSILAGCIFLVTIFLAGLIGLGIAGWGLSMPGAESSLHPETADLAVILAVPEQSSATAAAFPWLRLSLSGANIPVRICPLDTTTGTADLADKAWDRVLAKSLADLSADTGLSEQQVLIVGLDVPAAHLLGTVASMDVAALFMVNPSGLPLGQSGLGSVVNPAETAASVLSDDRLAAWAADLAAVWPAGRSLNLLLPMQQQKRITDPWTAKLSDTVDSVDNLAGRTVHSADIWETVFEYITGEDLSLFPGLQTKGLVKSESWLSTDGSVYLAEYGILTTQAPLLSSAFLDGLTARILDFLPAATADTAGERQLSALKKVFVIRFAAMTWILLSFLLPVLLAFILYSRKRIETADKKDEAAGMQSQISNLESIGDSLPAPLSLPAQGNQSGGADDSGIRPVKIDRQKKNRFLLGPIFLLPAMLVSGTLSWLWPGFLGAVGLAGTPGFVLLAAFCFALVFHGWWMLNLTKHRQNQSLLQSGRLFPAPAAAFAATVSREQDRYESTSDDDVQAHQAQRRQFVRDLLLVLGLLFTLAFYVGGRILLGTWPGFSAGLLPSLILLFLLFPLGWIDARIGLFMGQRQPGERIERCLTQSSWILFGLLSLYLLVNVLFSRPDAWLPALLSVLVLLGCKGYNRLLAELTLRPWLSAVQTTALTFLLIGLTRLF